MKIFLVFLLMFVSMSFAHAGIRDIGNGGNVVVCYDAKKKIKSIEIFDYYEARTKRNLTLKLGTPSLSVDQKVDLLLSRLRRLNPSREGLYRDWYATFFKEASIQKGVDLIPVPDVGVGVIPKNCEIKQVAGQQEPVYPGDFRYVINGDLWTLLNNDSKAGLIVHELILREAAQIPNNHTTSSATRYFHGVIAADGIAGLNLRQYIDLLMLVRFSAADAQNGVLIGLMSAYDFVMKAPIFYDDNNVKSSEASLDCEGYWKNQRSQYRVGLQSLTFCNFRTDFFTNKKPKEIYVREDLEKAVQFKNNLFNFEIRSAQYIDFYENGNVAKLDKLSLRGFEIGFFEGQGIKGEMMNRVLFFEDGTLKEVNLLRNGSWTTNGQTIRICEVYDCRKTDWNDSNFTPQSTLQFYETGGIKNISIYDRLDLTTQMGIVVPVTGRLGFNKKGSLILGSLCQTMTFPLRTQNVPLRAGTELQLDEAGKILNGTLNQPTEIFFPMQNIFAEGEFYYGYSANYYADNRRTSNIFLRLSQDMTLKLSDGKTRTIRKFNIVEIDESGLVVQK